MSEDKIEEQKPFIKHKKQVQDDLETRFPTVKKAKEMEEKIRKGNEETETP